MDGIHPVKRGGQKNFNHKKEMQLEAALNIFVAKPTISSQQLQSQCYIKANDYTTCTLRASTPTRLNGEDDNKNSRR